jgi:hypothetical protein
LTIDPSQQKDKNDNDHSFKIQLGSQPRLKPGLTIDPGQVRKNIIIIIVLKPDSKVYMEQGPDHESSLPLTHVKVRIKVIIIIIVLKPDSGIDSGQDPSNKWG